MSTSTTRCGALLKGSSVVGRSSKRGGEAVTDTEADQHPLLVEPAARPSLRSLDASRLESSVEVSGAGAYVQDCAQGLLSISFCQLDIVEPGRVSKFYPFSLKCVVEARSATANAYRLAKRILCPFSSLHLPGMLIALPATSSPSFHFLPCSLSTYSTPPRSRWGTSSDCLR